VAADSEDFVIVACTVLVQSQSMMETDRHHKPTDASTITKMRKALHAVAR